MEPETPREAAERVCEYFNFISGLLPVYLVGGFVAMVARLRKIRKEPDWKDRLLDLAITGVIGATTAGVAVAIVPLILDEPSPGVELAIGAIAGSYGQKTFDLIVSKILGREVHMSDDGQN